MINLLGLLFGGFGIIALFPQVKISIIISIIRAIVQPVRAHSLLHPEGRLPQIIYMRFHVGMNVHIRVHIGICIGVYVRMGVVLALLFLLLPIETVDRLLANCQLGRMSHNSFSLCYLYGLRPCGSEVLP